MPASVQVAALSHRQASSTGDLTPSLAGAALMTVPPAPDVDGQLDLARHVQRVGQRLLEAAVHLAAVLDQRRLQDVGDARLLGLGARVGARPRRRRRRWRPARRRRARRLTPRLLRPAAAARARSSPTICCVDVPGVKIAATPSFFSAAASSSGTMPPPNTTTSRAPRARSAVEHRRKVGHVRPRHHRQPDRVDRLLLSRGGDHLGRLVQAAVDDLVAGVGQRPGHDLGATVVPVEPGLRDQDAQLAFHAGKSTSDRRRRRDAAGRAASSQVCSGAASLTRSRASSVLSRQSGRSSRPRRPRCTPALVWAAVIPFCVQRVWAVTIAVMQSSNWPIVAVQAGNSRRRSPCPAARRSAPGRTPASTRNRRPSAQTSRTACSSRPPSRTKSAC